MYTLILPKNRINYQKYILFLSKFQKDLDFEIKSMDIVEDTDVLSEDFKFKTLIILKRYCYINFLKLNKYLLSNKYQIHALKNKDQSFSTDLIIVDASSLISKSTTIKVNEIFNKKIKASINDISKQCYLSNIGFTKGNYANSIFVCLNDNTTDFSNWLDEYNLKIKEVFYKNKLYRLDIGKTFFIQNGLHIGKLPNNQLIYWDNKLLVWKQLNKKKYFTT